MLKQKGFENDAPAIINASEPHMACLFLVDTSGSMSGKPIEELSAGLNQFKSDVCEDKTTRDILDVAIVGFNSNVDVIQDFVPVEHMQTIELTAQGGTTMTPSIQTALDMVRERSRFYRRAGSEPYKPWIFLISDGAPQDSIDQIAEVVHEQEECGKVKFFSLGVGEYDSKVLHQLSGNKVMRLKGQSFSGFFDWVNKSMRSVSQSSPGERPVGVPLPDGVDKDTNDWM